MYEEIFSFAAIFCTISLARSSRAQLAVAIWWQRTKSGICTPMRGTVSTITTTGPIAIGQSRRHRVKTCI